MSAPSRSATSAGYDAASAWAPEAISAQVQTPPRPHHRGEPARRPTSSSDGDVRLLERQRGAPPGRRPTAGACSASRSRARAGRSSASRAWSAYSSTSSQAPGGRWSMSTGPVGGEDAHEIAVGGVQRCAAGWSRRHRGTPPRRSAPRRRTPRGAWSRGAGRSRSASSRSGRGRNARQRRAGRGPPGRPHRRPPRPRATRRRRPG